MQLISHILRMSAAALMVSGTFTACGSSGGSHAGPGDSYPPGYYAPDVVTAVPRPGSPPLKPEHPVAPLPPLVVRPMPPMAPMPLPAMRR